METRKITKVLLQISMVYGFILIIMALYTYLPRYIKSLSPTFFSWLLLGLVIVLPLIVLYLLKKDSKYAGIVAGIPLLIEIVPNMFDSYSIDGFVIAALPILIICCFYTYACFKKENK